MNEQTMEEVSKVLSGIVYATQSLDDDYTLKELKSIIEARE